ncbi:MAG: tRNA-uridine aminocarboxypropyltransferase [Massilia sp.]
MPAPAPARRALCARCTRPLAACICRWISALDCQVELLILMHPLEVRNAKGSARLLHLSLANAVLVEGESFDPDALAHLLHAGGRTPVLLYPATPGVSAPAIDARALAQPSTLRLVVLDGTWRKSRKMLHQNPQLQTLPRLALSDMPPSQYLIRKAHAADQLSTLEASCHAIARLEPGVDVRPLLAAIDDFVAQFQATGGRLQGPAP